MTGNKRLSVGVIFGGRSGEHEVSLMSARSVLSALDREKYNVTQIGIMHDGTWLVGDNVLSCMNEGNEKLLNNAILLPIPNYQSLLGISESDDGYILEPLVHLDVVFPVLHGTYGEDGTIQGLLEMAGIAYVGAGVLGSSVGMDKGIFKDVMVANHIPVVESLTVLRSDLGSGMDRILSQVEESFQYPIFIKPANLGSSVGISKCRNRSDLLEGLMEASRYDRRIIIERGLNAREIEISVLGNDEPVASVPGEIRPKADFYSYEAKYYDDRSELLIPAPLSEELTSRIRQIAIQAYKAIDCAGMARVDFLLDIETNEVFLNEVNTIPGFTKISMYPKLWQASGISYSSLMDQLIELALERKADRALSELRFER